MTDADSGLRETVEKRIAEIGLPEHKRVPVVEIALALCREREERLRLEKERGAALYDLSKQWEQRAEAAESLAKEWRDATLNLAAVLHGDGGHWQNRPMTPAEVKEACIAKWAETVKAWDAKVYAAEFRVANEITARQRAQEHGVGDVARIAELERGLDEARERIAQHVEACKERGDECFICAPAAKEDDSCGPPSP